MLDWYYFSLPCIGLDYKGAWWKLELKMFNLYHCGQTGKDILIINGVSHLYRIIFRRREECILDEDRLRAETNVTRTREIRRADLLSKIRPRYEKIMKVIDVLNEIYVYQDSKGKSLITISEMTLCTDCGYQPRIPYVHRQSCIKCQKMIQPYGYLIIHDTEWIETILSIITRDGEGKQFNVLKSEEFVRMVTRLMEEESDM